MKLLRERGAGREVIGEKGARNHNHDDDTSSDPRLGERVNEDAPSKGECITRFTSLPSNISDKASGGNSPHRVLYCYYSQGVELAPQVCKPI